MQDKVAISNDGYLDFIELFKLGDLEQALLDEKDTKKYEEVKRYYFACIKDQRSFRLLEPLALLSQTLDQLQARLVLNSWAEDSMPNKGSGAKTRLDTLTDIRNKVTQFENRTKYTFELMKAVPSEVPKIMHFVWLGGGVGEIQRDYLNLWKRVMAGKGYTLNLWYDSDALLAHQTNKLIVEAAKADAHQQMAGQNFSADELESLYTERVIALKQQMHAHINERVAKGLSADEARIELLTQAYGQNANDLQALLDRNLRSVTSMGDDDLALRDLSDSDTPAPLQAAYEQETGLRGNLAAASDIVRAQVLLSEGGAYADIDSLPPLSGRLGETDITGWNNSAQLGVLQLLLDHNPDWMPGRQAIRDRYPSRTGQVPEAARAAVEAFARSHPSLDAVFQPPADRLARRYELRAVRDSGHLSNAYMMAHPGAGMLQSVIDRMRYHYEVIDATARLARQRDVAPNALDAMTALAQEVIEQTHGPLEALEVNEYAAFSYLANAVAGYFGDGVIPDREETIYLTGPWAMRRSIEDFQQRYFTPNVSDELQENLGITALATVNRATEEELDHSWKENETDMSQWFADERQRWQTGRFATRYSGDITQLLKRSTIEFESGWPLIEGRPVLLSDILQRLVDGLGEPLVQAMRNGHDGSITFEQPLPLTFGDRQAIKAQPAGVLPPAYMPDPELAGTGMDELLVRIANGTWHILQASPLQRLALGTLLGAKTLDNQSLMQLHSELDNFANSVGELGLSHRYAALERHMYKQTAPGFREGITSVLNEPAVLSGSALELKKNAMLEACTPFRWGRHVAQVRQLATLEHREQVLEKVSQVLQYFDASRTKLVPQDLLLQGTGDTVAGRCYPLALVMSAALARGEQASRRLRERFYLAVVEPEQSDSVAFLDALEELRNVSLSEVGKSLGRAELSEICTRLRASAQSLSLLLNSDNHAVLVAKTVNADRTTLHFFDPNFGLFEFDDPVLFRQALEHFFITRGMAGYYAAYGEPGRPMFDQIELKGEHVDGISLSAGFRLSQLLTSDSLPGHSSAAPIRQRMASARGRTLSENAHLGRSLLELDSRWWAQQIADVSVGLQALHAAPKPWVPLFDTLEVTPQGRYRMTLVDPENASSTTQVVGDDHRLLRIRQWLTEQFSTLARKPIRKASSVATSEVGAVHTLNAGFAIQALMFALRDREGADRTLTQAVRWHGYVNYAQLAHGLAVDAAGLMKLYKAAIDEEKVIARTCAPVVSEALGHVANEGVGTLLGLANVGFDIYLLADAKNQVDVARYATQLAFDSASFAVGVGGLGAAAAGAATAGAFLGGAGVMLGGLAIGVAALAQGFAAIAEEAKNVGLFFDHLEKAWRGSAYRFDDALQAWVVDPSSLIIEELDLNTGKVRLGSPMLYRLRDHFGVPDVDTDDSLAINIRQAWGMSSRINRPFPAGQRVVLPCTPQTYYNYEYKALPFASWRHDAGFDAVRRLERKDRQGQWKFLFSFYSFPSHYIVHRLFPSWRATTIQVRLDASPRELVVPVVPAAWYGLMTYQLTGAGDTCTVVLNRGVKVELDAPRSTRCRWSLIADRVTPESVQVEHGELLIDGIAIKYSGSGISDVELHLADHRVYRINPIYRRLEVLRDTAPASLDEQALLEHYKKLAQDHRLVLPYTPVNHYLIPFEDPQTPRYTTAWYDASEDRFLCIRSEEVVDADKAVLALVIGDSAYFYKPDEPSVWQVDAVSGLLRHTYRLLLASGKGLIRGISADAQGIVHVVQEYTEEMSGVRQFEYLIHDSKLSLCSVTHNVVNPAREEAFADGELLEWKVVLGDYQAHSGLDPAAGSTTVDWWPAPFVSVCWPIGSGRWGRVWVRRHDRLVINPLGREGRKHGWDDSIRQSEQLMLLIPAPDQEVFVIYDRTIQALRRLQRTRTKGRWNWSFEQIQPEGLNDVVVAQGGYVATTSGGQFFNLNSVGYLQFAGLSDAWLKGRSRWWQALDAEATQYSAERFPIVGLLDRTGYGSLFAWYIDQQVLLCESASGQKLRVLGSTPDKLQAWLFDSASGEIRTQDCIAADILEQAFADGLQLLDNHLLPTPQLEWEAWRFVDVTYEGDGLKGTTVEGVELSLGFGEDERVTGVNHGWVIAQEDHLLQSLASLTGSFEHDGFVSTEAEPGVRQWYDVENAALIRVMDNRLSSDIKLLGTRERAQVLLHDRRDGLVNTYPDMKRFGPFANVQRNAAVIGGRGAKRCRGTGAHGA